MNVYARPQRPSRQLSWQSLEVLQQALSPPPPLFLPKKPDLQALAVVVAVGAAVVFVLTGPLQTPFTQSS